MVISINTNSSADLGIQQLNKTNQSLRKSQTKISTGLKINGPKDDAATFAIAQALRGQAAGAQAVKTALSSGESTVNTALSAGQSVSDRLIEMKAKIVQANQSGLDDASRTALNNDIAALRENITTVVQTAEFNGTNLIESGSTDIFVLSSSDGSTITVNAQDLSSSGLGIDTLNVLSEADAQAALTAIDNAIDDANAGLAALGSAAQRLEDQNNFTALQRDNLREGIGNLVDADLGEEAANLASRQVKEQLGLRALAIANASPKSILSLFP